jgi:hypothetical protein
MSHSVTSPGARSPQMAALANSVLSVHKLEHDAITPSTSVVRRSTLPTPTCMLVSDTSIVRDGCPSHTTKTLRRVCATFKACGNAALHLRLGGGYGRICGLSIRARNSILPHITGTASQWAGVQQGSSHLERASSRTPVSGLLTPAAQCVCRMLHRCEWASSTGFQRPSITHCQMR